MPEVHVFKGFLCEYQNLEDLVRAFNNVLYRQVGHKTQFNTKDILTGFKALTRKNEYPMGLILEDEIPSACSRPADFFIPDANIFVAASWAASVIEAAMQCVIRVEVVPSLDVDVRRGIKEDGSFVQFRVVR